MKTFRNDYYVGELNNTLIDCKMFKTSSVFMQGKKTTTSALVMFQNSSVSSKNPVNIDFKLFYYLSTVIGRKYHLRANFTLQQNQIILENSLELAIDKHYQRIYLV